MKFGKHLLSSAFPEWLASYLDYKALKKAIKVQSQTGDTSLFDTIQAAEIRKAEDFHKAKEAELLELFSALTESKAAVVRPDEKTPLLQKNPSGDSNGKDEAWRSMPRDELLTQLDKVETLATNILKFAALNYTGVVKSLKKSKKKTGINSDDIWLPKLHETHFFRSRKCDEVIKTTTLIRREIKAEHLNAKKSAQGGDGGGPVPTSTSSSSGTNDEQMPSLWAFILGTFIHQIADNANKLVVPLAYLELTSVGVMSIITGVMTLLQTFGTLPAGRWSSSIGPKALIQWITIGRVLLTTTLAVAFYFYTRGAIGPMVTLSLLTVITSADWFIRGAIDTARNVLPMAYSQNSKKQLDAINIRYFVVFELGALVGPLVQGIILALGWNLSVTMWVPAFFLFINVGANFFIPEADPKKYAFLSGDNDKEETTSGEKKKKGSFDSFIKGIKECLDPTIGLLFILVILLNLNKIRLVIPQILAVELFHDDSFAAWIFSIYSLGGVLGNGVYALTKNTFTPATNMVFASTGVIILAVSWWPALAHVSFFPFLKPEDEWLVWVLLGAMVFSVVKQSARISLQSIFQYALKDSKSAADIMALNRFGVNALATGMRFALGVPFMFFSITTAFLSISGGLGVVAIIMFIGTFALSQMAINKVISREDGETGKEKQATKEREEKKKKKMKKALLKRELSQEELVALVDIPKNTGVLIVFEGLDGAGKSTQVERVKSYMQGEGYVSLVTTWSKSAHHYDLIRQLKRQTPMRSILLTVVQAMDFQQMIKQDVIPALRSKKVVLCDRYFYTGIARGAARGLSKGWLRQLFTADVNLAPDLVLYHRCDASIAVSRVLARSNTNTVQLSDDCMTHRVIVSIKSDDGKDLSRDLTAARISVYEAGLDVANPDLDPYDNFVAFQQRVAAGYDAMVSEYDFKIVDGALGRDEQEALVRRYLEPMMASLKKEVLRPFKTNLFDKNPKLDSGKKVKEYYMTDDGLHWYFRTMYQPMRTRLCELMDLSKTPRVFLHGNPHLNNFARFPSGSAMIDFDRTCIGPYIWDLIRLMVSTSFKQDGQDELGGTFLRPGVLQRLRSGYEWGLIHKDEPSIHPCRVEPFLPPEAPRPRPQVKPQGKEHLSMEILNNESEPSLPSPPLPLLNLRHPPNPTWNIKEDQEHSFRNKRLEELRKGHTDLTDELRKMADTYLNALGEEGNHYAVVEAAISPNWSGRTRTLLLFEKRKQSEQEEESEEETNDEANDKILVDIKPVRTDPDDGLFVNPYKPDYGKRMLQAQDLYARDYIRHATSFYFNNIQYYAHEVPRIKVGIKRPLTEADQRDILYSVGTQLGRGHALSVQDGQSVSHILFHLNFHWGVACEVSERLKDELTSAYRRYRDSAKQKQ